MTTVTPTTKCNLPNSEIPDSEWKKIEKKMKEQCYIGKTEILEDTIYDTLDYIESKGIFCHQISNSLMSLVNKYFSTLRDHRENKNFLGELNENDEIVIDSKFVISHSTMRGWNSCPFSLHKNKHFVHPHANEEISIYNSKNKRRFTFYALVVHLIHDHQFFADRSKSNQLVDDLIELLEILPFSNNTSYVDRFRTSTVENNVIYCVSDSVDNNWDSFSTNQHDYPLFDQLSLEAHPLIVKIIDSWMKSSKKGRPVFSKFDNDGIVLVFRTKNEMKQGLDLFEYELDNYDCYTSYFQYRSESEDNEFYIVCYILGDDCKNPEKVETVCYKVALFSLPERVKTIKKIL